jgi:hypothetical protein
MILYSAIIDWSTNKMKIEYDGKISLTSLDRFLHKNYPDFKYTQITYKDTQKGDNKHKYIYLK